MMYFFVDEAIKMCGTKEAKLIETTKQYSDILRSMKTLVKHRSEIDKSTSVYVKDEDIPVKEQQEIELLEQVLKKALKVRSSSAVPRNHGADLQKKNPSKNSNATNSQVPVKTTVKDADTIKQTKKSSSTELHGRHLQPVPAKRGKPLATKPAPVQIFSVNVQKKSCQTTYSKVSNKEKIIVGPPSEDKELKSSQVSLLKEQMLLSPLLPVWQAQRAKKNSLWNKVLTRRSKPVPEQACFQERLISTFLKVWPSGQVAVRGAELDALTQLGLDLTHCYHAELLGQQPLSACGLGKDAGKSVEREYESLLMLQGLERMMVKVIKDGDCLKKGKCHVCPSEWERKVGRPLCPLRKRSEWGDSVQSCLPLIMFYSTEAEFEELESLRLRVYRLQLEIRLHQVLSDTVTHHLTSQQSISGWPRATSLRGMYSLLGEGGAQFPTLVLDSEPNQT